PLHFRQLVDAEPLERADQRHRPHRRVRRRALGQQIERIRARASGEREQREHHPHQACAARCFSSRLRIFPVGVRGSDSTKWKRRGRLKSASFCRTNSASSSPEHICPAFNTTYATSDSPHSASGTPITAASCTAGCSCSRCSISHG